MNKVLTYIIFPAVLTGLSALTAYLLRNIDLLGMGTLNPMINWHGAFPYLSIYLFFTVVLWSHCRKQNTSVQEPAFFQHVAFAGFILCIGLTCTVLEMLFRFQEVTGLLDDAFDTRYAIDCLVGFFSGPSVFHDPMRLSIFLICLLLVNYSILISSKNGSSIYSWKCILLGIAIGSVLILILKLITPKLHYANYLTAGVFISSALMPWLVCTCVQSIKNKSASAENMKQVLCYSLALWLIATMSLFSIYESLMLSWSQAFQSTQGSLAQSCEFMISSSTVAIYASLVQIGNALIVSVFFLFLFLFERTRSNQTNEGTP